MTHPSFAIVVATCKAYSDGAAVFFELLRLHWPERTYKLYLITDEGGKGTDDITVINAGKNKNWVGRLHGGLAEVKERIVLLLFEDYFIARHVDDAAFRATLDIFETESLRYLRITNVPRFSGKTYKNYNSLLVIPASLPYGVNLQAALWEKEYLQALAGERDGTAWDFELRLRNRMCSQGAIDIPGAVVDTRELLSIRNGIIKGKWVPSTVRALSQAGFTFDLGARPTLSYSDRFILYCKSEGAKRTPVKLRKPVKAVLRAIGMKFLSSD